jgi:glycosyltransferase involved in cell wall biosynthesis
MDTKPQAMNQDSICPTKRRVLLIIEQCNPEWASVPLVGYEFYKALRQLADITLVTHQRNQAALEKVRDGQSIRYISESSSSRNFYTLISKISNRGAINWPLHHALSFPLYEEFNRQVYREFGPAVRQGEFDLVHAITPMMPRYPYKIIKACQNTPFILGPVNGGVPFPENFQDIAWREFAQYNFLRAFTHLIPGYAYTYRKADYIFAGSSFTLDFLQRTFALPSEKIELFPENGLSPEFFQPSKRERVGGPLQLLFVGRLVPYKGADILIEALACLPQEWRRRVHLHVVGDGQERQNLEAQVERLALAGTVSFAGWVDQKHTKDFYAAADIFCFPSIREFGGAVVLEAMASGLPSIVADNGGIAEYVTADCGFKIEPRSREYLVEKLADHIAQLCRDDMLRQVMGQNARQRAEHFAWDQKASHLTKTYEMILARRGSSCHPAQP